MNISDLKDDTGNLENYVLLRMFGDIRRNLALNPFVMKSVAVNVNEHGFLCELYRLGMLAWASQRHERDAYFSKPWV